MWNKNFTEIIKNEVNRQVAGGMRKRIPRQHALATINEVQGNAVMVITDDDPSKTPTGPFFYLDRYTPNEGDRVLMARVGKKFVVLDKLG